MEGGERSCGCCFAKTDLGPLVLQTLGSGVPWGFEDVSLASPHPRDVSVYF
jgi:hypothetical protein